MTYARYTFIALLAVTVVAAGENQRRSRSVSRSSDAPAEQAASTAGNITRDGKYFVQEMTGSIAAAPRIQIESNAGGIDVRGGAQETITYRIRKRICTDNGERARRALAQCQLQVRRRGDLVVLTVEPNDHDMQAEYFVIVPKGLLQANLQTRAGAIGAHDLDGTLKAETAGGNIEVDRIGGGSDLETAGGNIIMGTIGGRVRAETSGGGIKLVSGSGDVFVMTRGGDIEIGHAGRTVRAETAGGGIRVMNAGGDVVAESAGGNILIGEAHQVTVTTAGGSIQVDNALSQVRAETAAGSIKLAKCAGPVRAETAAGSIIASIAAARGAWGQSRLETSVGDITVYLPRDLAVTIEAAIEMASRSHRIISDFPLTMRPGDGPGPRELRGEGTLNGGGAPLQLRTVSGNIEIRSQK